MNSNRNDADSGASHSDAGLDALRAENKRLRNELERECADTDAMLLHGCGWKPEHTRTDGGSLKVAALSNALRDMLAPGGGG